MIHRTDLYDLCRDLTSGYPGVDGECLSLLVKLSSTLWYTGCDISDISSILTKVRKSYDYGGRKAVSMLVKGWSNCIRSILAVSYYDTGNLGYCRRPRNCRFALRKLGATSTEIDNIVSRYGSLCGIPPILLLGPYWRVLLGDAELSVYRRVVPLSNLGRASPGADVAKCVESEVGFFETTGTIPVATFDLTSFGRSFGEMCELSSLSSRIPLNSHSSFDYSRDAGGKLAEFVSGVIDGFLLKTIDDLVPYGPASDLYDVLGNLALRREDWAIGVPITEVMYPGIARHPSGADARLGLFGLLWAILELHNQFSGMVVSSSPYVVLGSMVPELRFDGTLPSKVHTLSEEGFKARVITIVKLSVAIIQGVARFFLDSSMRTDPMIKIGLLSKVKLYDFLVALNTGDRRGVADFRHPSASFRTGLSADLHTATDTPPRRHVRTLLDGFVTSVSRRENASFLRFAVQVGCSQRDFVSRYKPPQHEHRCGIMMGEGLSGTYLNVTSGAIRSVLHDFMFQFDFYGGQTVDDAKAFVLLHHDLIQDFLDQPMLSFGELSTQSGDDLIDMSFADPPEVRRFLILLYVILGLQPSESTFYSSEYYCTFTEEAAVKTPSSLGWVFLDCLKPRLFSINDPGGTITILSHISQISSTVSYWDDREMISRVCDAVDTLILFNRPIYERVRKYQLVPEFPSWLGGLDHPGRYLDGTEPDVPVEDRAMVIKLLTCPMDKLFEVKYSWASDDLPDEESAREIREVLKYIYRVFCALEEGSMDDEFLMELHTYPESKLVPRDAYVSHNTYRKDLDQVKMSLGLVNLDDIVKHVSAALRFGQCLDDIASTPETNPMVRLRNRREFLLSGSKDLVGDPDLFRWSDIKSLDWRLKSAFQDKVVLKDPFLELLDLHDLPSLSLFASSILERE